MAGTKRKDRYYVHRHNGKVTRIARLGNDGAFGWEGGKWVEMPGLWKIEWEVTDFDDITEEESKKLIAEERAKTEYYGWLGIDRYDTVIKIVDNEAYVYRVTEKRFVRNDEFLKAKYDPGSEFDPITEEEAKKLIAEAADR